jgi:hypothetical protein
VDRPNAAGAVDAVAGVAVGAAVRDPGHFVLLGGSLSDFRKNGDQVDVNIFL